MKKIMHILMLSCLKASEMIEKKLHFKLSFREKIQLKLHKMMCSACTNYEKHSIFIEKSISKLQKEKSTPQDTEKLKERITLKLESLNKE